MMETRLSQAIERGELAFPETGTLLVVNPPADKVWDFARGMEAVFVQGFAPDHDALASRGLKVVPDIGSLEVADFTAAIVFMPKARDLARYWIAEAAGLLADGGQLFVEGGKTEGIDACLKWCRQSGASVGAVYSKAHGKVFDLSGGRFEKISPETMTGDGYRTGLGVFSADAVDPGSEALAAVLPDSLTGRVADLGAGWGYLALQALACEGLEEIHLIEADHAALDAARQNISDKRAVFHWADATRFEDSAGFDHIICNPPFHKGRSADPSIGLDFISAAQRLIRPRGTVWLVANRHLPYEKQLTGLFAEVSELAGTSAFKLFRASKPKKAGARTRAR